MVGQVEELRLQAEGGGGGGEAVAALAAWVVVVAAVAAVVAARHLQRLGRHELVARLDEEREQQRNLALVRLEIPLQERVEVGDEEAVVPDQPRREVEHEQPHLQREERGERGRDAVERGGSS